MKKLLRFEVTGKNQADVEKKTLALYREYMNDPVATLPFNTVIDAKPEYETLGPSGTMIGWTAEVSISINASPY